MKSTSPSYLVMFTVLACVLLVGCDVGGAAKPVLTPTAAPEPGVGLVLKLVPFDGVDAVTPEVQEQARKVMEARARELGVSNPVVRSEEPDLLIVELRGGDNTDNVKEGLARTGLLEIVSSGDTPLMEGEVIITSEGAPTFDEGAPRSLNEYQTIITGRDLAPDRISYHTDPTTGQPQVAFGLNEEGAGRFGEFTAQNIGKYMPIVLDKSVISSPQIQGAIPNADGVITGLTEEEARRLVAILKAGSMPTRIELIETQQLGTSTNP